ncbi:aspartate/glutamate racemase family protein [Desulforhopalus sp. 52FAK]
MSNNTNILKGGFLHYDTPIGVLCLESMFPKPRGHVRNPRTYDFPTICSVVKGVDIPKLLFDPQPELLQPFIDAAQQLERDGVAAITGSCGFLARFQTELAEAVDIPIFVSSLVQLPFLRLIHGTSAQIGILTASAKALTVDHFNNAASDINDYVIGGMEGYPEFWETIIEGKRNDFDMVKLEEEICHSADELVSNNNLDALLLECTDLSAFAHQIQKTTQVPVYDINSLVEYVAYSVCRKQYT